jgi:hypothetical protein
MNQGVKNMPAPADHETTVVKKADKKPQRKKPTAAAPVPDLPLAPALVNTEAYRISRDKFRKQLNLPNAEPVGDEPRFVTKIPDNVKSSQQGADDASSAKDQPATEIILFDALDAVPYLHQFHTLLLRLVHQQELDLTIEKSGSEVASFTGPFDQIDWEDLNLAQTTARSAIARASLFAPEMMRTQLSIDRQPSGKWNLICTLWLDSPTVNQEMLSRAQSVGIGVLREIRNNPKKSSDSIYIGQLEKSDQNAVREVTHETLCHSGGHSFKKQIAVFLGDEMHLELKGRMCNKPDLSRQVATLEVLEGTFRGFINDRKHKQHILLFSPNGSNNVEIGFTGEKLDTNQVDLEKIAVLNKFQVNCKVHVKKTLDVRGKTVYAFVSIEVLDDDAISPPVLVAVDVDENKNSVTETSMAN